MHGEPGILGDRRVIHGDDEFHAWRIDGGLQDPLGQDRCRNDDSRGAAVGQYMQMIPDAVGGVGRNRYGAGRHDRDIGDRPFGAAFRHQRDAIALSDTKIGEGPAKRRGSRRGVGPAGRMPVLPRLVPQKRLAALFLGPGKKQGGKIGPVLMLHPFFLWRGLFKRIFR